MCVHAYCTVRCRTNLFESVSNVWQVTRFDKLITAVKWFLREEAPYGSYVGIIAYAVGTHVQANMTEILSEDLRNELEHQLPLRGKSNMPTYGTATGKGILKGLEVTHFVYYH